MTDIGDLKRWPARDLWPGEATHFNPWLADNLGVLDAALSPEWSLEEGEVQQSAGSLWVDIVARTSSGQTACIEAQFGTSNHDHLGKLLTYIAAYDRPCRRLDCGRRPARARAGRDHSQLQVPGRRLLPAPN
jgi:hypothetical protein